MSEQAVLRVPFSHDLRHHQCMKAYRLWAGCILAMVTTAGATGYSDDLSGVRMQRYDALNEMGQFPGRLTNPQLSYLPPRSLIFVNVLRIPEAPPDLPLSPKPSAAPRFWIAHCGGFVEINLASTANLIEEEQRACQKQLP